MGGIGAPFEGGLRRGRGLMSAFAERLSRGGFAVALEITPPKKRLEEVLLRRARLLPGVDAINVIQRPDRLSSLDASLLLAPRDGSTVLVARYWTSLSRPVPSETRRVRREWFR